VAEPEAPVTRERPGLRVPEADLDELRSRLRGTRWPRPWPRQGTAGAWEGGAWEGGAWEGGTDADELRRLVGYWAEGYDWRAQEAAINALPLHVASLDGTDVFYLRFDAEVAEALPIVLTHGWPSSFLELTELARRLAAPAQYGGQPGDAFTVIVPALPGFPLSPQRPIMPATPTHELWHRLMHDELGFPRYGAHGGDLGAGVTSRLAAAHPEAAAGIHLLAVTNPADYDAATITPAERDYLDATAAWFADDGGYEHEQMTRPRTLSYGLSDSPAGLLAWFLEKYRAWSDCDGELSRCFSDDFILTQASMYWFTNTISTSFRPYYEHAKGMAPPVPKVTVPKVTVPKVTVPTAVAVFPKDLSQPPRSWAERSYNVTRYTVMPRGGHFAAHEEPALLAADLTEFYRHLR
jgi:pimeloyl-ACP methyl ester carboxylesterase